MSEKLIQMAREHSDATKDARGRESFCFDEYGLAAFRVAVLADVGDVEPVAFMYPSDLEQFQRREMVAEAVSVSCTDINTYERTVPLYSAATVAALVAERDALREALQLAVRQNSHDMLMTGEELRQCEAAIAAGGKK